MTKPPPPSLNATPHAVLRARIVSALSSEETAPHGLEDRIRELVNEVQETGVSGDDVRGMFREVIEGNTTLRPAARAALNAAIADFAQAASMPPRGQRAHELRGGAQTKAPWFARLQQQHADVGSSIHPEPPRDVTALGQRFPRDELHGLLRTLASRS